MKKEVLTDTSYFLTAQDVAQIIHRSPNHAYKLIDMLNKELAAKGYITIRARIPRAYFMQRCGVMTGGGDGTEGK